MSPPRGPLPLPIETKRLLLREFVVSDWEAVHAYSSDPEVVRYLFWGPNDEQQTRDFIARTLAARRKRPRTTYALAVVRKADGRLIGACELRLGQHHGAELAYAYHRDAWGQGYGSEAARALAGAGFRELRLHRVFATCATENTGSARVMEKIGMRREGHLRQHLWMKSRWRDSYLYAVLADEWHAGGPGEHG